MSGRGPPSSARDPQRQLAQAVTLHRARRYQEAESLYRQLLQEIPDSASALCMLGTLACETGRLQAGAVLLEKACRIAPLETTAFYNLADAYRQQNNTQGAAQCYEHVLRVAPHEADAHAGLAAILMQQGHVSRTIELYSKAIALQPGVSEWHNSLGVAHRLSGNPQAAIEAYRVAIQLRPDLARTHNNLGIALHATGRYDLAVRSFAEAIRLEPNNPDLQSNLGSALRSLGHTTRAVELLGAVLARHPEHTGAKINLANALVDLDRVQESLVYYRQALELQPGNADLRANFAMALEALGEREAAADQFRVAQSLDANHPDASFCLGLNALAAGDFASGWEGYEHRWYSKASSARLRPFRTQRWNGEPLTDKRLLIHAEQGIGDEIMFASLYREVFREARHCVIECSSKLEGLFRQSFPEATVVGTDTTGFDWQTSSLKTLDDSGVCDLQIASGSLPRLRRRRLEDFASGPYLTANADRVLHWKSRLDDLGSGPWIGLSWRGGTHRTGCIRRSLSLEQLLPLLSSADARFVSLQYTDCAAELQDFAAATGITVHHWQESIDDYAETAALVTALDLTVSVCTSVIHLGGALGRPVWVLAPTVPEWRYGISGERLPWYETVRVFRQPNPGDWSSVLATVNTALSQFVGGQTALVADNAHVTRFAQLELRRFLPDVDKTDFCEESFQ